MTRLTKVLGAALMLVAPALSSAQTTTIPPDARVAFVSVQRISTESLPGKAAVARIQSVQQQRTGELRAKQMALASLQQQLERAATADERTKLSAQLAAER